MTQKKVWVLSTDSGGRRSSKGSHRRRRIEDRKVENIYFFQIYKMWDEVEVAEKENREMSIHKINI